MLEGWRLRARQECHRPIDTSPSSLGERLRAYIDADLSDRITLRTLAHALRVSPRAAANAFYRDHRLSVSEYVLDRRLKVAHVLLASGVKVEAVSLCAGFGSRTTLYRSIKKRTGLTPRSVTAAESYAERTPLSSGGRRLPDITREPCASCRRLLEADPS